MKLPRQPQIVTVSIGCIHGGDGRDAADLIYPFLQQRFDHTQLWKDDDGVWVIKCYPRAVND